MIARSGLVTMPTTCPSYIV